MLHLELLESRLLPSMYSLTDLGDWGDGSGASAINQKGLVVGWASDNGIRRPVYFDADGPHELASDLIQGFDARAAVNDAGWFVGANQVNGEYNHYHAILANAYSGEFYDLTPDCYYCKATGINNAGRVVGYGAYASPEDPVHAYVWYQGKTVDLGEGYAFGINNQGWVVGISTSGNGYSGVIWSDGQKTILDPLERYQYSVANAINDNGQVVGYSDLDIDNSQEATLWSDGKVIDLGNGLAQSINTRGQVVGNGGIHGIIPFLWENGNYQHLQDLLADSKGWMLENANGINDAGQIVGMGWTPEGSYRAFRLDPVGDAPFWWAGWALGQDKKTPESGRESVQ